MIDRTKEKEELVERIAQEKGLTPFWMSSETTDEKLPLKTVYQDVGGAMAP